MKTIVTGLLLPEGPVALADGSTLVVEVGTGRVNRIFADGRLIVVAELGGGANGAAIGPDGGAYVCNNGSGFACTLVDGFLQTAFAPERYVGGSIQRVDLATGAVTTLYAECDGTPLLAPNDIVFDASGGFWFTDHGMSEPHRKTYGAICYALPDGSAIRRVRERLISPNGIGISPDGRWLYWADTLTARVWRAEITAPGALADYGHAAGELVVAVPGDIMLDSLAVEAGGFICVGCIKQGGIAVIDPENGTCEHMPIDDFMVTNLCFGGADMQDVWFTAAGTGRLLRGRWPRPGLAHPFDDRAPA